MLQDEYLSDLKFFTATEGLYYDFYINGIGVVKCLRDNYPELYRILIETIQEWNFSTEHLDLNAVSEKANSNAPAHINTELIAYFLDGLHQIGVVHGYIEKTITDE